MFGRFHSSHFCVVRTVTTDELEESIFPNRGF
jgi:hypothetical protein